MTVRILYFADIRFPLERANGIQTMETCHALAERGHRVALVVKRDTHDPPRDPFEFYGLTPPAGPRAPDGLPAEAGSHEAPNGAARRVRLQAEGHLFIEYANAPAGAGILPRVGYLSFALGRGMGRTRTDVLMTRDLGLAALLLRIPRRLRAPLVYESHGYAPDVAEALPNLVPHATPPSARKRQRLTDREAFVWRSAEGYVAITRGIVEHMEKLHGARPRLAVVPDGVRLAGAEATTLPEKAIVGYAGHLYAWKGVDAVLRAIALLANTRGLIIGGHEQEPDIQRLKDLARSLGIQDRVTFTGLVAPARVGELLAQAFVLVLPNPASAISTHFTSPLKLFEYMAVARPIVASDLPAIREIVSHERNALLVAPADGAEIAGAVQRLLDDRALAERLARTAHADAREYTWARRAERLERLFAEIVAA